MLEEIERLKEELAKVTSKSEKLERENEELKKNLSLSETNQRKAEEKAKSLKENRGKILRGLNTQTEIALVQFKRDFEIMKKQLEAKDETIRLHERRIKSLVEANCTLRNGLQQVHGLPHPLESESEDENGLMSNGHGGGASVKMELDKFIQQLNL